MLIAIDLETGGLIPGYNPILEIGACCRVGGEIQGFSVLVQPTHMEALTRIDAQAARVNGYPSRWENEQAKPLREALLDFSDWLGALPDKKLEPLAHHAAFDKPFLLDACAQCEVDLGFAHRWRCSMASALFLRDAGHSDRVPESSGLAALAQACGAWDETTEKAQHHSALHDARACLLAYEWMMGLVPT